MGNLPIAAGQASPEQPFRLVYTAGIPIRWGDMDAFGHVNNTVYFRYMEQARICWFSDSLGTLGEGGNGPVLINAGCTFLRQLRYPGTVDVHIFVGAIGRSSMETAYRLERSDEPGVVYAEGAAKIVWVSFADEKSMALPGHIRERLPGGSLFEDPRQG
ncbi:acyl-CoA thioesterase [Oxalobacteraceae bacterium CAVE-383]|nr:acyl-CoA thioesterase [Oxalobacteraceae bacterium CAVE-383]